MSSARLRVPGERDDGAGGRDAPRPASIGRRRHGLWAARGVRARGAAAAVDGPTRVRRDRKQDFCPSGGRRWDRGLRV